MDGKYRGYVYGGKSTSAFAGGIKSANTTTDATMPLRTAGFKLKDTSKNTIWTAPKNTQYKASKVSLYGAAADDTFTVDQAATKTREGSLYYHVTDTKNSAISGWIYAGKGYVNGTADANQDLGGLTLVAADATATADNSVKVVYRDANSNTVSNATWVTTTKDTKADSDVLTTDKNAAGVTLADFIKNNKPAGYSVAASATTPKYGQTVYATVTKASVSTIKLVADSVNNTVNGAAVTLTDGKVSVSDQLTAADFAAPITDAAKAALTGKEGESMSAAADTPLTTIKNGLATTTPVKGLKTYHDANAQPYHYEFTFVGDNFGSDNRTVNFGGVLKASYKVQLVSGEGAGATSTTDNSWIA